MATSFWSLPMTSGGQDMPVGVDELGNTVMQTIDGVRYVVKTQAPQRESYARAAWDAISSDPAGTLRNALAGAAQGAWDAVATPRRSWSDTVTYGDVANTAGLVSLPAVAGKYDPAVANMGIRAYHGSPHDFDRFDMSKIGTGEGAQAYGHGLYFAEAEDVAKDYKKRLASYKETPSEGAAIVLRHTEGDRAEAVRRAKAGLESTRANNFDDGGQQVAKWEEIVRILEDPKVDVSTLKEPGRMYEVDINADPADFLDWDAPLSEQPAKVRDGVIRAYGNARPAMLGNGRYGMVRVRPDGSGDKIHGIEGATPEEARAALDEYLMAGRGDDIAIDMSYSRGTSPDAATDALREAGIPGIKYYDQGSRAGKEGTRNYVVFDDSLIDIIRKYGWAAVAPLMAANGSDQAQY